jgi:zinc transport system substrate-binding protein
MTKPQTGCLHDYTLNPEDLKTIENADIFVVNGAGMESFLEDVIKQHQDLKIVEASRGISLIKDKNGEENAHVWVSVSNYMTYVKNIAEQLAAVNPGNADRYSANAAVYVSKLEALREDMHKSLDKLKNRNIITFHEAYPYFAQEFKLNIVSVIEREPDTGPMPRELGEIIDIVEQSGVKALFAEPQYPYGAADVIARETGAKVYTLDPVVTGDVGIDAFDDYINKMEQNKKTLQEALNR